MDRLVDSQQLAGWIPVRLHWGKAEPTVDWCYSGSRSFGDQCFDQIVNECLRLPFNLLFRHQTPIEVLVRWSEVRPGLTPTGFIFHLSRSGSSLVSRLLAGLQRNIVISEARPIDAALRAHFHYAQISAAQRILWLRWMISALAQQRRGDEQHLFIRFDAWNTLELPLIRQAFPDVPWIFVYRDPFDVLVSHMDQRGPHTVPGAINPLLFGMDSHLIAEMEPEEYCAKVLLATYEAALRQYGEGCLLINHSQLPEAVWAGISEFFGVDWTEAEVEAMKGLTKLLAKNSTIHFQEDSARKHEKATERIREAASRWLYPIYEELEKVRMSDKLRFANK
jgi:hypothetical protein